MKKNLIVLLLIPFLIALLGVVTINTTFNIVDNDIVGIKWNYSELEVFEKDAEYLLYAEGINEKNYPAGKGNNLVWTIKNIDSNDDTIYGEIVKKNSFYYFIPKVAGECIITCSNEKGNVFKSMNAIIYEKGTSVVTIKDKNPSSQTNIDPNIYYGEYDLVNGEKQNAKFNIDISISPANDGCTLFVENKSDNISVDLSTNTVTINASGDAFFTINGKGGSNKTQPRTFSFKIVDEGVNVYSYDDLLNCTNRSAEGEVVVLRKSFESLDFITDNPNDTTVLFGNYNEKTKKFNFSEEVYRFTTTYNKNFIDQWNEYIKSQNGKNFISTDVLAGLHVQKNFYGNGYSINMHNLTYPTGGHTEVTDAGDIFIPEPGKDDLFHGPLPFYAMGDHNNMPLIEAYGQDNIGMYVDGDNILVNDLNLRNCDRGNLVSNLNSVGTVLETYGNNITIKNCKLSNGKNVIRSFSSMNTLVKNCYISSSRNFLITIGTNEYYSVDEKEVFSFKDLNGNTINSTINEFLKTGSVGDEIMNSYLEGTFASKEAMRNALRPIQTALNKKEAVEGNYKGSMTVEDTYFVNSGIASIALEIMFNGAFLQSSTPSGLDQVLQKLSTNDGTSLDKLKFKELSGTSYPVELTLKGKTRFYDYKTPEYLDLTGLICENISKFAGSIKPDYKGQINIDKIFPVKDYLMRDARNKGYVYNSNYINVPIAFYGGGVNASVVNYDDLECKDHIAEVMNIDFMDKYLELKPSDDLVTLLKNMMLKAVTVAIGDEPFKFICMKGDGYLYEEDASVQDLIENAKGA